MLKKYTTVIKRDLLEYRKYGTQCSKLSKEECLDFILEWSSEVPIFSRKIFDYVTSSKEEKVNGSEFTKEDNYAVSMTNSPVMYESYKYYKIYTISIYYEEL